MRAPLRRDVPPRSLYRGGGGPSAAVGNASSVGWHERLYEDAVRTSLERRRIGPIDPAIQEMHTQLITGHCYFNPKIDRCGVPSGGGGQGDGSNADDIGARLDPPGGLPQGRPLSRRGALR